VNESENSHQKAISLLKRQWEELQIVRALSSDHPRFKSWEDTTQRVLEKFLGKNNQHTIRFADTSFFPMVFPSTEYEDLRRFKQGCATVDETLKAAIRDIEDFGVYEEYPKPANSRGGSGGGLSQNFHGPVSIHNFAIATDNAMQKIEHMGDQTGGASLKQIAKLFQQSEELSPRQVKEGLAHIEAVAVEVSKSEVKRNWKTVLESGNAILELTNKATDLAKKLAPYTPVVVTWIPPLAFFTRKSLPCLLRLKGAAYS
jgi:hypothetical protein